MRAVPPLHRRRESDIFRGVLRQQTPSQPRCRHMSAPPPVARPPRPSSHGSAGDASAGKPEGTLANVTAQPVPALGGVTGFNGTRRVPLPVNEPVRGFAPGSSERTSLKARLESMAAERIEIP